MAAGVAQMDASDFAEATLQLAAAPTRVLAHASSRKDELVAEGRRNRAAGFQQRFQMGLRGLLKTKERLTPVATVRVAAGQEGGAGDPDAIFIPSKLHLAEWNNHGGQTLPCHAADVKRAFDV